MSSLNPYVIVETAFMQKAFPVEERNAASLINDFMEHGGFTDMIARYDLQPFAVHTQTLARTLIDNIFAICDYYLSGKMERCSRHLYDIMKLVRVVPPSDDIRALALSVRSERAKNAINRSAADGVDIPALLERIITERVFESDYNNVTKYLLYEDVDYDFAISGLQTILQNGIF